MLSKTESLKFRWWLWSCDCDEPDDGDDDDDALEMENIYFKLFLKLFHIYLVIFREYCFTFKGEFLYHTSRSMYKCNMAHTY